MNDESGISLETSEPSLQLLEQECRQDEFDASVRVTARQRGLPVLLPFSQRAAASHSAVTLQLLLGASTLLCFHKRAF